MRARLGDQIILCQRSPGFGDHHRSHRLVPALMRQADNGDLLNTRIRGVEGLLYLERGDVLAASLNDVLETILEPEQSVGVEMPAIAGMKPAMRERGVGRGRIAQIFRHYLRAAVHDLA